MQTLSISQLTESQLAQVRYLFADHAFGTDACAFMYEVDKAGEVKGRSMIEGERSAISARARRADVCISLISEVNITERLISQMQSHMDTLAVSIATKLHQSKLFEEVSNEQN